MTTQNLNPERLMAEAVAAQLGAMGLQLLQAQVAVRLGEGFRAAAEDRAASAEGRLSGIHAAIDRLISLKPVSGDLVFAIEALELAYSTHGDS